MVINSASMKKVILPAVKFITLALLLARLESAYSLISCSHKIWGKGGGDTLDLLW